MDMIVEWVDGENLHKKHKLVIDPSTRTNQYTLSVGDYILPTDRSILNMFNDLFKNRQTSTVEVLYSGGLDSELVLRSCILNKIPVTAITLKLLVDGIPLNTHDLYYSEKFCRLNNVTQKIVDLEVRPFFESGDYQQYIDPYYIVEPHVATHFWLLNQCSGYPIVGGDYYWPQVNPSVISPMKLDYSCYDKYMKDNNIHGIGNALNHSLEISTTLIKKHIEVYDSSLTSDRVKAKMYDSIGMGTYEPRRRSYGWEITNLDWFNKNKYKASLIVKHGMTKNSISWGDAVQSVINGSVRYNDTF